MPLPSQLFNLADIAIGLSRDGGRFRRLPNLERAHIFYVADIDNYYQTPSELITQTGLYAGKIARSGFNRWEMSLMRRHNQVVDDVVSGYRVGFVFNWSRQRVHKAQQRLIHDFADGHVKPGNEAYEGYVDDDFFQIDYVNGVDQLLRVSVDDCEELIREIKTAQVS